jgi:hypothetical protein
MFLGGWILCVEEYAEMFRCWNVLYVKRFVVGPVLVGNYVHGDTFCRYTRTVFIPNFLSQLF